MTESEAIKWQKQLGEVFKGFHLDIEEKMNISCEMAIKALKKQVQKKPTVKPSKYFHAYYCPVCNGYIRSTTTRREVILAENIFCGVCGQKLDWSDEE